MKTFEILSIFVFSAITCSAGTPAGAVIGWGDNTSGAVSGTPYFGGSTDVVAIAGQFLTNATAVAAGSAHAIALRSDGTVVGWGFDHYGQADGCKTPGPNSTNGIVTIDGQILSDVTAVAAWNNSSLALKRDGSVIGWGVTDPPTGLTNIVAITRGSVALKEDGTVVGWGASKTPVGLSNLVAIAASGTSPGQVLAVKNDGTVIEWEDQIGVARVVNGLSNIAAVAVGTGHFGGTHYLVLKSDGTIWGWGLNSSGQATGVKNGPSGSVTISGQIVNNIIQIAAGIGYGLGLKDNGTVIAWGDNRWHQNNVPAGLSNIVAIAAGNNFCIAITTNNEVANRFSQK